MEIEVATKSETSFQVGDMAVHPAHGVGEVTGIEKRDLGGSVNTFYVLRIIDTGLKVMIPVRATTQVGLRRVMSKKEADKVLRVLEAPEVAVDIQPWNRRFRAYTEMLKSGSPYEIAKVLRDMSRLKFDKELSFGERRLLDQAKSLLIKELALAKQMQAVAMEGEIRQILSA
jgi:CarD family transcriptional regulator